MQSEEDKRRAALLQQQNRPLVPSIFDLRGPVFNPQQPKVVPTPIQTAPTVQQPKIVATPTTQPNIPAPFVKQPSALPFFMQPSKEAYQLIPGGIRPVVDIKMPTTPTAFEKPIAESLQQNLQKVTEAQNLYRQNKISSEALTQLTRNFINEYNTSRKNQEAINLLDKPINTFIENYNTMSDPEQRGIRNKLQDVITSFNAARTPELKQKADTAAYYLNVLTTPKSELLKKASEQEKPIIEALPEAKAKQSFLGTVKDITKSVFLTPANIAQRVSLSGQAVLGKNLFAQNEADLAAGRISQTEFDRRQSEINAKIAEISGSLTGEDKGLFDRILRSLGIGAEVATYLLPGGGILRGVRAAEGKLPSTILKQAALGTGVGATSAFARTGVDTQPTEIVAAGLLGGVFQGAVPAIAALTTRTIARIKEKPFEQLQQSEKDLLQKEGEFHPQDPNAPVTAQQAPGATQPPKTATTAPEPTQAGSEAPVNPKDVVGLTQSVAEAERLKYEKPSLLRRLKNFWDQRSIFYELDNKARKLLADQGERLQKDQELYGTIREIVNSPTKALQSFSTKTGKDNTSLMDLFAKNIKDENFWRYLPFKRNIEAFDAGEKSKLFKFPKTQDAAGNRTFFTIQEQKDFVKFYEKQNPNAKKEAQSISQKLVQEQKMLTEGQYQIMTPEEFKRVRTLPNGKEAQFYFPISRVQAEELLSADIKGQNLASVGRQKLIQALNPGSELPVNFGPETYYNWFTYAKVLQSRIKAGKIFKRYIDLGLVPANVIYSGEQVGKLAEAKGALKLTRREINQIKSKVKISARQERKLASELNKLQKEGLKVKLGEKPKEPIKQQRKLINYKVVGEYIKNNAPKTIDDLKTSYIIKDLLLKRYGYGKIKQYTKAAKNEKEFAMQQFIADVYNGGWEFVKQVAPDMKKSTFDNLVKQIYKKPTVIPGYVKVTEKVIGRAPSTQKVIESLIKTDSPTLVRIKNKIITREPKLAAKIDEVINYKNELENLKAKRTEIKGEISDLALDPKTGKQVFNGIDEFGRKYSYEIPPEYAKEIFGYNKIDLNKGYKAIRAVSDAFKAPIIALNPSFQLVTSGMNILVAPLYSKEGFRLWNPKYISSFVKSFSDNNDIIAKARGQGVSSFTGNLNQLTGQDFIDAVAKKYNAVDKINYYKNKKGAYRLYKRAMEYTGKLDQGLRAVAFESAYNRAKKSGLTEGEALALGAEAWTNAAPDFSNVAPVVKAIDLLLWFFAPTQASLRGLGRAFRENPKSFLGKASVIVGPMAVAIWYSIQDKELQEFYKDMKESKKDYVTSNNIIYKIPGQKVSKNETTGEWSGIGKIPIPPELRPLAEGLSEGVYSLSKNEGLPPEIVAKALFNTVTGKVWDVSNPMYNLAVAAKTGKDPRTNADIYDDTMTDKEKAEAVLKYWSKNSGPIGQIVGTFMPNKKPLKPGEKEKNAFDIFLESFSKRFVGAYGSTPGSIFYQSINDTLKEVPLNKDQLNELYSAVIPPSKDLLGRDIKSRTPLDPIKRYLAFLDPTKPDGMSDIWRFMVKVNEKGVKRGLESNPLYELPPEKARVIATMNSLFEKNPFGANALKLQNPWLQDFYNKSSAYFDKIMAKKTDEERKALGIDVFGNEIPKATPDMQKKLNEVQRLTEAEAKNKDNPTLAGFYKQQRNQFYADNPDITEFYQKQEDYKRLQDKALGLPLLDMYPRLTPELKAIQDEYNALPKGNGPLKKDGTPSSPDRSNWIKNNPEKWGKLTTQWTLQDIYNLQKEGGNAMYEGVDFTDKGLKAIKDIAGVMGMSTTAAGNMWANFQPQDRIYLGNFIAGIKGVDKLPEIKFKTKPTSLLGEVKQYKVKLPEPTRQKARIKLQ